MTTYEQVHGVVLVLEGSGEFSNRTDVIHYMVKRSQIRKDQAVNGNKILYLMEKGSFTPKPLRRLSDEEFRILVFDLNISDSQMSQIFGVSAGTISRRRQKLDIARDTKYGGFQEVQWLLSKRNPPVLEEFIETISI